MLQLLLFLYGCGEQSSSPAEQKPLANDTSIDDSMVEEKTKSPVMTPAYQAIAKHLFSCFLSTEINQERGEDSQEIRYVYSYSFEIPDEEMADAEDDDKAASLLITLPYGKQRVSSYTGKIFALRSASFACLRKLHPQSVKYDQVSYQIDHRIVYLHSDNEVFQSWFGVPLFQPVQEKHRFRYVNPEAIAIIAGIIPKPRTQWEKYTYQQIYTTLFREFFRNFTEVYTVLQSHNIDEVTSAYLFTTEALGEDEGGELLFLESDLTSRLEKMQSFHEHLAYEIAMQAGFWLRRNKDQSAASIWDICLSILSQYDPQWLKNLQKSYSKIDIQWEAQALSLQHTWVLQESTRKNWEQSVGNQSKE